MKGGKEPILAKKTGCFEREEERTGVYVTKMSYLDAAQPGPQCTVGPLPIVGNPRSFSVLAAEGNRHLPQRERKSRRCGLVVPEIGAELARGQISV